MVMKPGQRWEREGEKEREKEKKKNETVKERR